MTLKRLTVSVFLAAMVAGPALGEPSAVLTAWQGANAWTPKPGDEIRFNVLRQGKPFGSHLV